MTISGLIGIALGVVIGIEVFTLYATLFEFLCAQTPHTMKGLIVRLSLASAVGLRSALAGATLTTWAHAWSQPLTSLHYCGDSGWSSDVWDCGQVVQEEGEA